MTSQKAPQVFVTGATGLLGNNLVRLLLDQGYSVKALVRSAHKAAEQFADIPPGRLEWVVGDLRAVEAFAPALAGCELLFHTAAYFRESYTGGRHRAALRQVNVDGTRRLLQRAYAAGVRRAVHISSIAVLGQAAQGLVDERMTLAAQDAPDDYYLSKIETDQVVYELLQQHPDLHIALVLPGWMHGPGDLGPTSAGQFVQDYLQQKIPGVLDAAFSVVDARDVAQVALAAARQGGRGERYLAAGHPIHMAELLTLMERLSGVAAPRRRLPRPLLYAVALVQEAFARLTGRPVLLSLATVRNMASDYGRRFSAEKIRREFGLGFRPLAQTLSDELAWWRQRGLARASLPR